MAEQWYYSQNGQEIGPVSASHLQQRAESGQLTAHDLVWCEGMQDWAPAGQVKALMAIFQTSAPPSDASRSAAASTPQIDTGKRSGKVKKQKQQPAFRFDNFPTGDRRFSMWLLMAGIVLVLTAKGCDGLGNRNVQRLRAKSDAAREQFQDVWEAKRLAIQTEIDDLRQQRTNREERLQQLRDDGETPTAEQLEDHNEALDRIAETIDGKNEEIAELKKEEADEQRDLTNGDWRDLRITARDAARNNAMWAYWREMLFVFGSQILTVGLLLVGFNGDGAERWICLIMLAIITFSVYVGGAAWISSIGSLVGS